MKHTVREYLPDSLQPYEPSLYAIVREAIALFLVRFGTLRAGMTIRSERSNIHDCMVEMAKRFFPANSFFSQNLFTLRVGGHQIKLKKHNESLETSSQPTQMVLAFDSQERTDLFGEVQNTNIQLGYIPDGLDLMKSSILITCPRAHKKIDWVYELRPDSGATLSPIPTTTLPDGPSARPSVTPKRLPNTGESKEKE